MLRSRLFIPYAIILLIVGSYFFFTRPETILNSELKTARIVAFGDSLVAGVGSSEGNDFASLLSKRINQPIINLGKSGDTTLSALDRIQEVLSEKPTLVIILLGGNDYLRQVPIDTTFKNLGKIIDTVRNNNSEVLLLGVRGGLLKDTYNAKFKSFAKEKNVTFVPNVLDGLIGNKKYMFDTIHPNDAGYVKVADKVEQTLREVLKKQY